MRKCVITREYSGRKNHAKVHTSPTWTRTNRENYSKEEYQPFGTCQMIEYVNQHVQGTPETGWSNFSCEKFDLRLWIKKYRQIYGEQFQAWLEIYPSYRIRDQNILFYKQDVLTTAVRGIFPGGYSLHCSARSFRSILPLYPIVMQLPESLIQCFLTCFGHLQYMTRA